MLRRFGGRFDRSSPQMTTSRDDEDRPLEIKHECASHSLVLISRELYDCDVQNTATPSGGHAACAALALCSLFTR
jgi:hypothetical protein